MIKEASRQAPSLIFEGMTSISAVIKGQKRCIERIYFDKNKTKSKSKELSFLKHKANELDFTIEFVDDEYIENLTTGNSHGGIIAQCTEYSIPSLTPENISKDGFYVMIEGIEDPYNFGYALRTIYAAGADGVILTKRNWMSAAGVVCRSSAGASEMIQMFTEEGTTAADIFKDQGYTVAAAGIRNSVSAFESDLKKPIFLIVGGEKRGISASLLEKADQIVRLDYGRDFNGSLSAASAASILAYEVLRQNLK